MREAVSGEWEAGERSTGGRKGREWNARNACMFSRIFTFNSTAISHIFTHESEQGKAGRKGAAMEGKQRKERKTLDSHAFHLIRQDAGGRQRREEGRKESRQQREETQQRKKRSKDRNMSDTHTRDIT